MRFAVVACTCRSRALGTADRAHHWRYRYQCNCRADRSCRPSGCNALGRSTYPAGPWSTLSTSAWPRCTHATPGHRQVDAGCWCSDRKNEAHHRRRLRPCSIPRQRSWRSMRMASRRRWSAIAYGCRSLPLYCHLHPLLCPSAQRNGSGTRPPPPPSNYSCTTCNESPEECCTAWATRLCT